MIAREYQNMHDRNKGFKRSKHQFYPNPSTTKPGYEGDNVSTSSAKRIVPGAVAKRKETNSPNNYEKKEILTQVLDEINKKR